MGTYYFVIMWVAFFTYFSERYDYIREDDEYVLCSSVEHTRSTRLLFVLASAMPILASGLRYHVGTDSWQYERNIPYYAQDVWSSFATWNEPGIRVFAKVATLLNSSDPAPIFFFITSLFICVLYFKTIYKQTNMLCMSSLLFIFLSWADSFNGIRQYMAAVILFAGISFLKSRKLIKWIITVIIASLFHRTAIVMLLLYFVVFSQINIKNLVKMIAAVGLASIFYEQVLNTVGWFMDESMTDAYSTLSVNVLRILVAVAPTVLFWSTYIGKEVDEEKKLYLNLLMIHSFVSIIAAKSAYLSRITIYTTPYLVVGIPNLLEKFSYSNKKILRFLILVLYFVFWWYDTFKSSNLNTFHWIWERIL
jgi:transmembrane protein EpsG